MPDSNIPMSKEAIIKKVGRTLKECKGMFDKDKILIPDHLFTVALDEYAKQMSIAFDIWKRENGYHWNATDKNYYKTINDAIPTEHLYNLFLESIK